MEGEEGLRTLESLRGRLQAERATSRKAKEAAESMDTKLKELEQQLKKEIKARKREEKRLDSLMKKLQSLNIIYTPSSSNSEESSEQSSFNSESSFCISSTGSTGFIKVDTTEEDQEENLKKSGNNGSTKVVDSDNVEEIEGEGKSSPLKEMMKVSEENSCSKSSDCHRLNSTQKSNDEGQNPSQRSVDSNSDDHSLKSDSVMGNTNEVEDDVGNTMALVPVINNSSEDQCSPVNKEVLNYTSEDVRQVLDTLKQIRERLQTSIGDRRRRSHIIKVG